MTGINWASLRQQADDATKPVPTGRYDVRVVKAEFKNAQSSGAPMIVTNLRVVGGASDGKTLFNNFVLTLDNAFALKLFFNAMDAFGVTQEMLEQLGGNLEVVMPALAQTLVDRVASVEVGIRQWQGHDRNECKNFQRSSQTVVGGTVGSVQAGVPGGLGMTPGVPAGVPSGVPAGVPVVGPGPVVNTGPSTPPPGLPI